MKNKLIEFLFGFMYIASVATPITFILYLLIKTN